MEDISSEALRVASIVGLILLLIAIIIGGKDVFIGGIIIGAIFGGISFLITRSLLNCNFELRWYQWIFYVIGWISGIMNILFWIIMYAIRLSKEEESFVNRNFHKRVFWFGVVITLIYAVIIILMIALNLFNQYSTI
ncbi:MAG: hypothetical protein ACP5NW_02750 [Candidatus Woesearchaeota archaeon]